ncbi:MAG: bifunctional folylpolyglutamate synthase/dihydrofolate synthase [Alphaproteobacteria bacterium]|nr:MAG: bifunctional folylpolyglutamate synthase/dihydrofolate synthase [Alphaproteobacteria bacterium]
MHQADLKHDDKALRDKLETIFQLRRTRSKINWDRGQYLDLLAAFGNPHLNLPPVIHVAGTNGKGSIIAILQAILQAQGLKVHSYTSPHLIHVNERITLAGQAIDNACLEQLIDQALDYNKGAPLSFFEITTALAFKAFADTPADILLLEVGLGGRLDCTNVIDAPLASVINRISLDHTDFLGNDIRDIAMEKAGIMKADVPCISGYQGAGDDARAVNDVLTEEIDSSGAYSCRHGTDWNVRSSGERMTFSFKDQDHDFPLPSLQGAHQVQNAGVALATLFSLRQHIEVSDQAIEDGLKSVYWPGRLQKLAASDFYIADNTEIWLDSGHNDSAGEALAAEIKQWQRQDDRPLHLVMGMLDTKDSARLLASLLPHLTALHIVSIVSDPQCQTKDDIEGNIKEMRYDMPIYAHESCVDAIHNIARDNPSSRILIAGSVYLAGEVLEHIGGL